MQKDNLQIHTNSFAIQFAEWTTIRQLLLKHAPIILQPKFAKRNEKEISKFVFVFRLSNGHQKWKLKKRFYELHAFERIMIKRYGKDIPTFPLQRQHDVTINNIDQFGEFLNIFLKKVINTAFYDEEVQNFFDILPQKFGQGIIYGEFPIMKQSGGRYNEASCCKSLGHFFFPCTRTWRTRWFTVTDNGLFYSKRSKTYEVQDMLVFCNRFRVQIGKQQTGDPFGITIISAARQLTLHANNISDFAMFVAGVKEALSDSPFSEQQRFESFAPIRQNCYTKFYADGQFYFKDICTELRAAKKYVYITDWMITPYFMLERSEGQNQDTMPLQCRLDKILEQIANRGVSVFIILYQQPKMAINNDSQHAQKYLRRIHHNIKVVRHPNYMVIPFLWSHHQKSVLIDQKVAFVGGLDICYGRWDNSQHSLTNDKKLWTGADYCNLRITDIYFPRNFMMCSIEPRTQPRMPWHDVAVQIRGNSVHDLARHFTTYWNFVNFQTVFDDRQLLTLSGRNSHSIHHHPHSLLITPQKQRNNRVVPMLQTRKDSKNSDAESELVDNLLQGQYYQKYLDETVVKIGILQIPRMHVIKENIKSVPKKLINFIRQPHGEEDCLMVANQNDNHREGKHSHQFLRSASTWSLGLRQKQQSIHEAYLRLIETAEHFIYIENQFFICKENLIVEKLAERISKAHYQKKQFKVVIFLPLLPGFEGDVREQKSAVMRIQLYWQYWTICRSSRSLYRRLKHIPNIQKYLCFFSLRQHGISQQSVPLTEILYIHSKLMIVDDRRLIIGSANINDRSLNGQRDSQLCILIEDQNKEDTKWGYPVSLQIQKFRISLFVEHFGVAYNEAQNFMDESFWGMARVRARTNTLIYRQLFGCYPDDTMLQYGDIEDLQKKSRPDRYVQMRKDIQGHVVQLPLKFLERQDLNLSAKEKQYFLPTIFFT